MEMKKGARVRFKVEEADGYQQPYRRWIKELRPATVTNVDCRSGRVTVKFDCARKPKRETDYSIGSVRPDYLVVLST